MQANGDIDRNSEPWNKKHLAAAERRYHGDTPASQRQHNKDALLSQAIQANSVHHKRSQTNIRQTFSKTKQDECVRSHSKNRFNDTDSKAQRFGHFLEISLQTF